VTEPVLEVALLAAEHDVVAGRFGEEAGTALDLHAEHAAVRHAVDGRLDV
jgi:hypothetical protein